MLFAKVFAVAALAVGSVLAQSGGKLAFTQTPSGVKAGTPTTIKWSGGNGGPVSVILKKGDSNDLKTVAVLTGSSTSTSYDWTPDKSLPDGSDYALAITQGQDTINYSGQFSLSGGASGSSLLAVSGSSTSVVAVFTNANSSTVSATTSVSVTPVLVLTGASASGTGASVSRNTTFISPTLSASGSSSSGSATATSSSSRTSASAGSSSSAGAAATVAAQAASGLMGAGALAAVLFL